MKYYAGLDLGGTFVKGGIVDETGAIVRADKIPTGKDRPYGEIAADMAGLVRKIAADANVSMSDVAAVGIGSPGTIDSKNGVIYYSNNIAWNNVPLCAEIEKNLGIRAFVTNDANAAALGAAWCGAGRKYGSIVFITLGTGVGGGVIIDGKLFQGFRSAGAELGHVVIRMGGAQCTCGRKGCFEAYASATALIRQTREAMEKHPESKLWDLCGGDLEKVEGKTAFDGQALGDETAKRIVSRYVKYLAEGLVNICNEFRPEAIVLGGGVCGAGDVLLKPLKRRINRYIYGGTKYAPVKVVIASLGNDAGLVGAVKYAIDCVSAR